MQVSTEPLVGFLAAAFVVDVDEEPGPPADQSLASASIGDKTVTVDKGRSWHSKLLNSNSVVSWIVVLNVVRKVDRMSSVPSSSNDGAGKASNVEHSDSSGLHWIALPVDVSSVRARMEVAKKSELVLSLPMMVSWTSDVTVEHSINSALLATFVAT